MQFSDPLPPDLDQVVRAELERDERLAWTGVPQPKAYARAHLGAALFGIIFAGFAVFWMAAPYVFMGAGTTQQRPPIMFTLFGVPFFLVGAAIASSPLWMRRKAARSVYALTDRRAIVIEASVFRNTRSVTSYRAAQLGTITRVDRADGSGDIVFDQIKAGYQQNDHDVYRPRGFIGVKNVREVERLLRSTLRLDEIDSVGR